MAERFDILVEGITEEQALSLVLADTNSVKRPADRYFAATRLGLSDSDESLHQLLKAVKKLSISELYDKITRRKCIEALGRRKDQSAIPVLKDVLQCEDQEAIINAINSLVRIGWNPDSSEQDLLLSLFDRDFEVTTLRAVIQAHSRMKIKSSQVYRKMQLFSKHESALISGSARAYLSKMYQEVEMLTPLLTQIVDVNAGKRRSAVIDLGDAESETALDALVTAPVSMSLRSKSFLQIVDANRSLDDKRNLQLFEQLVIDDPRKLNFRDDWRCEINAEAIESNLSHRDEARQYGAALSLMLLQKDDCLRLIDSMQDRLWSDYVTHYYLTCIIGLRHFHEKSYLIRSALAETTPQYSKSRIAAAWACLNLPLFDQMELLYELAESAYWRPLRWTCQQVFGRLIEKQQISTQT